MIGAALDVVAAATKLATVLQEEHNTPAMIAAARAKFHQAFDDHLDELEAVLKDPNATKQQKDEAFATIQKLMS